MAASWTIPCPSKYFVPSHCRRYHHSKGSPSCVIVAGLPLLVWERHGASLAASDVLQATPNAHVSVPPHNTLITCADTASTVTRLKVRYSLCQVALCFLCFFSQS